MKRLKSFIDEALVKKGPSDTVVFTFGRFNPPSIGHLKLLKLVDYTAKGKQADAKVFTSHIQDTKKNPLDYDTKVEWLENLVDYNNLPKVKIVKSNVKTPLFNVVEELAKAGYKHIIAIVGDDRLTAFARAEKYAKENGAESFEVLSACKRDPDAEGVEGMSAGKLRALVANDDFDTFVKGVPFNKNDAKLLFKDLQHGMGIGTIGVRLN